MVKDPATALGLFVNPEAYSFCIFQNLASVTIAFPTNRQSTTPSTTNLLSYFQPDKPRLNSPTNEPSEIYHYHCFS